MADYLYGLVPADTQPPTAYGIADRPVSTWPLDGALAVLRSEIDSTTIQPRRAHLMAHDRVLAAALAAGPVLPLRFGAIAEHGPATVLEGLDRSAAAERMEWLSGRAEVQVLWEPDEEDALRRIAGKHPQIRDSGRAAIDRGQLIVEALNELAVGDLTSLVEQVAHLAVTVGSVEARGRSARVATLVESERLETFLDGCRLIGDQVETAGTLRTVGALPPYSFAALGHDAVGAE